MRPRAEGITWSLTATIPRHGPVAGSVGQRRTSGANSSGCRTLRRPFSPLLPSQGRGASPAGPAEFLPHGGWRHVRCWPTAIVHSLSAHPSRPCTQRLQPEPLRGAAPPPCRRRRWPNPGEHARHGLGDGRHMHPGRETDEPGGQGGQQITAAIAEHPDQTAALVGLIQMAGTVRIRRRR